jgi:hypothetical protein
MAGLAAISPLAIRRPTVSARRAALLPPSHGWAGYLLAALGVVAEAAVGGLEPPFADFAAA